MSNTEQPGVPEEALFAVKCWLYPQLCRFNKHGGRFVGILANAYQSYDKITACPTPFNSVEFVDESLVDDATFRQICEWIAQYTTRLTSDLAAARENASQNADRYLACEKRFEEAIAQRDAANLRVEGLEKEHQRELERLGSIEGKAHLQTIDERDRAEEALSQAYFLVIGRSPEWSNLFGHEEAIEDIDDAQKCLRAEIAALTTRLEGLIRDNQASAAEVVELRQRFENREAAVCPEDYSFEEVIAVTEPVSETTKEERAAWLSSDGDHLNARATRRLLRDYARLEQERMNLKRVISEWLAARSERSSQ